MIDIEIVHPGLMTTFQDKPRLEGLALGVPFGGPFDSISAKQANALVGNPEGTPVLEMTLMGPRLKILGSCHVAVTGAELDVFIDSKKADHSITHSIEGQAVMTFGKMTRGCRAYLAIGGRWLIDEWMGSASPVTLKNNGLIPGGALRKGEKFSVDPETGVRPTSLAPWQRVCRQIKTSYRLIPGPEWEWLTLQSRDDLDTGIDVILSAQSNRMAYVMEGPLVHLSSDHSLISSGIVPGTIQAMPDGRLMALMVDAQVTGGYPRIANFSTADVSNLAQVRPGEMLHLTIGKS